jgi:hypothetical protein
MSWRCLRGFERDHGVFSFFVGMKKPADPGGRAGMDGEPKGLSRGVVRVDAV